MIHEYCGRYCDSWTEDGDASDLVHLLNKEMREGLTPAEEERKAVLIKKYKSK